MITKSTGYTSSDGKFHATLEDAQTHELQIILRDAVTESGLVVDSDSAETLNEITEAAKNMMKSKGKLIDILTMKPNSLPKARKINGGTKKRTKPESHTLPFTETTQPAA